MKKVIPPSTTNSVEEFIGWFPEISERLFKHLKVTSLVLTVQSTHFSKPKKFIYKKELVSNRVI